jgi:hypothetical protein
VDRLSPQNRGIWPQNLGRLKGLQDVCREFSGDGGSSDPRGSGKGRAQSTMAKNRRSARQSRLHRPFHADSSRYRATSFFSLSTSSR